LYKSLRQVLANIWFCAVLFFSYGLKNFHPYIAGVNVGRMGAFILIRKEKSFTPVEIIWGVCRF
jgi:hypothetical protein